MRACVIREATDPPHRISVGTIVRVTQLGDDIGTVETQDHGWFFFDELEPLDHDAVEVCVAASDVLSASLKPAPRGQ